jgi:glycosyltransferase involved in cell wall biosynthesis
MHDSSLSVSVIISNYNYADFVAAAIDSALGIDWPDVEVIVVDDGSTDGSRAVIESYGERINAIFQQNAGQLTAFINGFRQSTGDLIIFLDSDDLSDPTIIREVSAIWRQDVSKVQVQMRTIDINGRPLGSLFPQYQIFPTSDRIRKWVTASGAYPTPPGSGNVYSRKLVEKVFSFGFFDFDRFADSSLLAAAPYLGDILVVAKPLVSYRVHGRNDGAFTSVDDVHRFSDQVRKAIARISYAQKIARSVGISVPDNIQYKSLTFNPIRLASFRLAPALHPIPGDTTIAILFDTLRSTVTPQGLPWQSIAAIAGWTVLVALCPIGMARSFILWRFAPTARPQALRGILQWLRILRSGSGH